MAIKLCKNCVPHPYQDGRYGQNMRVMNRTAKKDPQMYRCTVCGKETS